MQAPWKGSIPFISTMIKDVVKKRAYEKAWHAGRKAKDPDYFKKRSRKNRQNREALKRIDDLKRRLGCSRCPENDPDCLDFHHLNPSEKTTEVSRAANELGWSWERVKKEISKCVLLCANCHRKETAKQRRNGSLVKLGSRRVCTA